MTFDERFRQFLEMSEMVLRGYEDRVRRERPQAGEREVFCEPLPCGWATRLCAAYTAGARTTALSHDRVARRGLATAA
jgi:hypothetical protein